MTGSHPLYIGAYYKPKEDDLESLVQLRESLDLVQKKRGNIWLLGDFNLPKLSWPDNSPVLKPDCSYKRVYEYFLDIVNDFGLCQLVTQPTRGGNILDLFLTSNQALVDVIKCSPGLSDHDIVTALGSLKPQFQKKKPRKVHLFAKADWTKLKSLMKVYQESFLSSHKGKSVEQLWNSLTSTLTKHMNECIPSKTIKG